MHYRNHWLVEKDFEDLLVLPCTVQRQYQSNHLINRYLGLMHYLKVSSYLHHISPRLGSYSVHITVVWSGYCQPKIFSTLPELRNGGRSYSPGRLW